MHGAWLAAVIAIGGCSSSSDPAEGCGACGADEYCDFSDNRCGDVGPGRCAPRPANCPQLLIPELTCGCDGLVRSSPCDVALAGGDLDETGACDAGAGAFACGYRQCALETQYCLITGSDVGGEPDSYECRALPAACGSDPSCACLEDEPCNFACTGTGAAGLTVTCPGG